MDKRATCWSVTINNPTATDEENIALARQKKWTVIGQLEVGKEGTPHYQLLVKTPQVRFAAIKKQFPRAHIEVAINNVALAKYVTKEDTRVGALKSENEWYPSQAKVWAWFAEVALTEMQSHEHSGRDLSPKLLLTCFDVMINIKIREGYYCEHIAVNPQVRTAVLKYGAAIVTRHRRQTDRQTRQELIVPTIITNASETENLPPEEEGGS